MQRVALIGLGKMGLPIARNLMDRGFAITGYRRSGSPELAQAGGTVAGSPAEVAAQVSVLLSIVPDAAAVEEIICGPDGTLTTLRPGTIHIEMSTIDVGRKTRLRDAVRARGGDLLDCPVSGSPGMVAPRRATTFASGDKASVDQVAPVLDAVSGPIEDYAAEAGLSAPVFTAAKEVFDKALADGWGDLDIASAHDQISGASALSQEEPS